MAEEERATDRDGNTQKVFPEDGDNRPKTTSSSEMSYHEERRSLEPPRHMVY